jgi:hypothetical protein
MRSHDIIARPDNQMESIKRTLFVFELRIFPFDIPGDISVYAEKAKKHPHGIAIL